MDQKGQKCMKKGKNGVFEPKVPGLQRNFPQRNWGVPPLPLRYSNLVLGTHSAAKLEKVPSTNGYPLDCYDYQSTKKQLCADREDLPGGVFHVVFCFTSCGLLSWNTLLHFIFHLVSPAMQVSFVAVLSFPTRICCFQREPCALIPTRFRRQDETSLAYQAQNQTWTLSIAALV